MRKIILLVFIGLLFLWGGISANWFDEYRELKDHKKPEETILKPFVNSRIDHDILTRKALYFEKPQTASRKLHEITNIGNDKLRSIAHFNLGNYYLAIGKKQQALMQFKEALKLDPGNYEARYNYELLKKRQEKGEGKKKKGEGKKTKELKKKKHGKGKGDSGDTGW